MPSHDEKKQKILYNKAYEDFVTTDDDVIGLIAYGLYKQEKRRQIISNLGGKEQITQGKKEQIEKILLSQKDNFRKEALVKYKLALEFFIEKDFHTFYNKYCKNHFEDTIAEKIENTNKLLAIEIENKINARKDAFLFWPNLGMEVLGNLSWTILLIIISAIVYFNAGGFTSLKKGIIRTLSSDTAQVDTGK